MAVFRCKRSGNTITLTNENDIAGLRVHEGYTEVKDVLQEEVKEAATQVIHRPMVISTPKRGRPRKTT